MELIDSLRRILLNDVLPAGMFHVSTLPVNAYFIVVDVDDTRLKQLCATAKERADAICLELMKTEPGSMDMIDERLRCVQLFIVSAPLELAFTLAVRR